MSLWVMPSVDAYENFLKQSQAVEGGGHPHCCRITLNSKLNAELYIRNLFLRALCDFQEFSPLMDGCTY